MAPPRKPNGTVRPVVETPERLRQAGGGIVDMPTERAGFPARRFQPVWERLMVKDVIDERQGAGAAAYSVAFEKVSREGFPPSLLARLEVGIGLRGDGSRSLPISGRAIVALQRYRLLTGAIGDDRSLVDGVVIADLTPTRDWQLVRLRAALDRLATAIGL